MVSNVLSGGPSGPTPADPSRPRSARSSGASRSLSEAVLAIERTMRASEVPFASMRGAGGLEMAFAGAGTIQRPNGDAALSLLDAPIERLEGHMAICCHRVPSERVAPSRLRAFLDGSQKTLLVWRIGLVPIVATVAAAAILRRDERGNPSVMPGTLRLRHAWLIPRRTGNRDLANLLDALDARGMDVIDPLAYLDDDDAYAAVANQYGKMIEAAYVAARGVREEVESGLLDAWGERASGAPDGDWLVVDGRLRLDVPNAIGLVKDVTSQHLVGQEAVDVFELAPGHRTSAYRPRDNRRSVREDDLAAPTATDDHRPTLWYLRLRDHQGQDARHALVRVEAPSVVTGTAEIDRLSAWVMAERAPRATADARWDTLLYPIHYLELILKRHIASSLVGWPGGQ
ncbi:MAG: hypothetical protein WKF80_05520 [Thermomicrobiales bacterium]